MRPPKREIRKWKNKKTNVEIEKRSTIFWRIRRSGFSGWPVQSLATAGQSEAERSRGGRRRQDTRGGVAVEQSRDRGRGRRVCGERMGCCGERLGCTVLQQASGIPGKRGEEGV